MKTFKKLFLVGLFSFLISIWPQEYHQHTATETNKDVSVQNIQKRKFSLEEKEALKLRNSQVIDAFTKKKQIPGEKQTKDDLKLGKKVIEDFSIAEKSLDEYRFLMAKAEGSNVLLLNQATLNNTKLSSPNSIFLDSVADSISNKFSIDIEQKDSSLPLITVGERANAFTSKQLSFFKDSRTKNIVPTIFMDAATREAQIALDATRNSNPSGRPGRQIEQRDLNVQFDPNKEKTFRLQFATGHFGFNLDVFASNNTTYEEIMDQPKGVYKKLLQRFYQLKGAELKQRVKDMCKDPNVLRLDNRLWRGYPELVSIYYNLSNDRFVIVDPKPNYIIGFGVASESQYIDIFAFKQMFVDDLDRSTYYDTYLNLTDAKLAQTLDTIRKQVTVSTSDLLEILTTKMAFDQANSLCLEDLKTSLRAGVPEIGKYSPQDGWWYEHRKFIQNDPKYKSDFDRLEKEEKSLDYTNTSNFNIYNLQSEDTTATQLQNENFVKYIYRPDNRYPPYKTTDLDYIVQDINTTAFGGIEIPPNVTEIFLDRKGITDPTVLLELAEAAILSNVPANKIPAVQDYEFQVRQTLHSLQYQRKRVENVYQQPDMKQKHQYAIVVFAIDLLEVPPMDRELVQVLFKQMSEEYNISLKGVAFINTSMKDNYTHYYP